MELLRRIGKKKLWIAAAALLVAALLIVLCVLLRPAKNPAADPNGSNPGQETKEDLRLPDLLDAVKAIKANLLSALEDIKQNNYVSARNKLNAAQEDIVAVQALIRKMPLLIKLVPQGDSISALLEASDEVIPEILLPAVDLLETRPLSDFKAGDGYDADLLCAYIDFAESVMPKLENLLDTAGSLDLSLIDSEGKIEQALESANELMDGYRENPQILSMTKTMLGAHGDRAYLIAVQNPSEIRASGGFPGFMGMLRIREGVLTLSEFESVREFLITWTPKDITITQEERALFHYLSGIHTPRDADLCPDFERVGHIWASAYEQRHNEPLSGVISVTPHLVQRLLAATGVEIELADGSLLTGENAMKVLIHDIYFKYFDRRNPHPNRLNISDALFAEAAEKTMRTLTGSISLSTLPKYLPVMKECIEDRTLMLWMRDEAEQAFMVEKGWHGGLNKDPQNPQAGIYVNVVSASKMGWFLLMDSQIGERTKNADGSYTYPITVTFDNNITQEEINAADSYISGGLRGSMRTVAYFFAPAGGTVENFTATNGQKILLKTYNGMALGFTDEFMLRPNEPITFTYTVTTAPGAETPLELSKTPTGQ